MRQLRSKLRPTRKSTRESKSKQDSGFIGYGGDNEGGRDSGPVDDDAMEEDRVGDGSSESDSDSGPGARKRRRELGFSTSGMLNRGGLLGLHNDGGTASSSLSGASAGGGTTGKRKRSDLIPPLDIELKDSDILRDLHTIHRDWTIHAQQFNSYALKVQAATVVVEKDKLLYKDVAFEVDTPVVVTSELTCEDFVGTLIAIGDQEIYVRLVDGTKTRVLLGHLRNGRVSIRHNGSPAGRSKQSPPQGTAR